MKCTCSSAKVVPIDAYAQLVVVFFEFYPRLGYGCCILIWALLELFIMSSGVVNDSISGEGADSVTSSATLPSFLIFEFVHVAVLHVIRDDIWRWT